MSQQQYDDLVKREMARYGRGPVTGRGGTESARDAAVRNANIQAGFGNSTALRKLQQNAVGGGVKPETMDAGRKAGGARRPGGPKTSRTGPSIGVKPNLIEGDPANVTSPSGAGGFYQPQGMQTPTGAPGFYTGADPGLTRSPTSVAQPALGPTTQPSAPGIPADLNRDEHGFHRGPWGQPPASVGLGMQPKFPYDMPAPSNVPPPSLTPLVPPPNDPRRGYGMAAAGGSSGVGMPGAPGTVYGGPKLIDRGGYVLPKFRWWG
jgi:hypothetical protein